MALAGWWRNKKRDRLLLRSAPFKFCCPRLGLKLFGLKLFGLKLFGLQPRLRVLQQRAISAETVKTDRTESNYAATPVAAWSVRVRRANSFSRVVNREAPQSKQINNFGDPQTVGLVQFSGPDD